MEKKSPLMFIFAGVFLLVLLLYSLFVNEDIRNLLLEEGGYVESASALGYLLCAIFVAFKGKIAFLKKYHYFLILLVLFTLRELDFHDKFTTMGIFKTKFYISDGVPFVEKLIGAFAVGFLLYAVLILVHRHFKQFWHGLKGHSPPAMGALAAVILVLLSKLIDGIGRKLNAFDIEISYAAIANAEAMEEIIELGIPIFIFISFFLYFTHPKDRKDAAPDSVQARSIVAGKLVHLPSVALNRNVNGSEILRMPKI